MPSLKSTRNVLVSLAFVGGIFVVAGAAQGEWRNSDASSKSTVPWAGQGCGWGSYRAPNGTCDIVKNPDWRCQAGFHDVHFPGRNDSRCVINEQ